MGPKRAEELAAYYSSLRNAVRVRLEWENRDQLERQLDIDPLHSLSRLMAIRGDLEEYGDNTPVEPPLPEILELYRLTQNTNLPYRAGGLEDQPFLMLKGFMVCMDEERRMKNEIALNQAIQAMQQNATAKP